MIKIVRTIHRHYTKESLGVFAPRIDYVDAHKPVLFEIAANIHTKQCTFYRSIDNGDTWNEAGIWDCKKWDKDENTYIVFEQPSSVFVDPDTNVAFRINAEYALPKNTVAWAEDAPLSRFCRHFISYSYDSGITWTNPDQLILDGDEYNEQHWMDGVNLWTNSAILDGANIVKLSDGDILLTGCKVHLWPSGNIFDSRKLMHTDSFAIRGRWNNNHTKLKWQLTGFVPNDYNLSQKGLNESAVVEISPDLIVMLSRIQWPGNEDMPMMKLLTTSSNGGRNWTQLKPLCYDDGTIVPSVASFGTIIKSTANSKIYYISNILPELLYWKKLYSDETAQRMGLFDNPPKGLSDPRSSLYIAEFDCQKLCIKKDSVTLIDKCWPGEPPYVRLSNFGTYQDRKTGNIVLHMTRDPGNVGWKPDDGISRDSFRYDIQVS